jgi:phospholipase C
VQEPRIRPSRAVPYELQVRGQVDFDDGVVKIHFGNTGKAAAVYQVYSGDGQTGPWTYTVAPHAETFDTWDITASGQTEYDLSVFGPNGFLRVFEGSISESSKTNLESSIIYDVRRYGVRLEIHNHGERSSRVRVFDYYKNRTTELELDSDQKLTEFYSLENSYGWYDFTIETESDPSFQRRLVGHLETGYDSMSDPAIGASKAQAQLEPDQTRAYASTK